MLSLKSVQQETSTLVQRSNSDDRTRERKSYVKMAASSCSFHSCCTSRPFFFFSLSVQKEDIANVRVFSLTSSGVECIVIEIDHLSKCCFVFLCFSSLFDTTYSVVSLA